MTDVLAPESDRLHELIDQLRVRNAQLERALESRVVIEQAKGILGERFGMRVDDAFALMRRAARSSRVQLRVLARRVVEEPSTPAEIERERSKPS